MNHRLASVRQAARKDRKQRFTALFHHVCNIDTLAFAFWSLDRDASPGIDGKTWQAYEEGLEDNLRDLAGRLKRGAYRASAVRRVFIPKTDGRQRPVGIPTLEDKIVQRALVEVMNAIYEVGFLGLSYGFRPERSQHDALDAVTVGLTRRKVNWVLDADIRGFFDTLNHEWLVKFVEHRIADARVVRLIRKWLRVGVVQDGVRTQSEVGTPQGGSISPLLANIYLQPRVLGPHGTHGECSRGHRRGVRNKSPAAAAGIDLAVSPHCMRHAHASHALDRGGAEPPRTTGLGTCFGGDNVQVPPRQTRRRHRAVPPGLSKLSCHQRRSWAPLPLDLSDFIQKHSAVVSCPQKQVA